MIQSELLKKLPDLAHGFSEKRDGNLSLKASELKGLTPVIQTQTFKNRQRFLDQLGIAMDDIVLGRQTHSDTVEVVTIKHKSLAKSNESPFRSADTLVTAKPDIYLTLFTADCLPIFIADQHSNNIAAIHAGWRGLAKDIIQKTLSKMRGLGSMENDLLVWIGPHIKVCHYLLDPKSSSYEEKKQAFGDQADVIARRNNQEFLDLTKVAMRQLETAGIAKEQIEVSTDCTACHSDRFFSYHESQGNVSGIMMGVIGRRG